MNGKKHFYHKGNFEYEIDAQTPIEVLLEIKKDSLTDKQKAWLKFLNQTGCHKKMYNYENPEQDLGSILGMFTINSQNLINQILSASMEIDDFRPWLGEEIPLDKYPKDVANLIRKKQNYMLAEYCFRKEEDGILVQSYHPDLFIDHDMQLQIYDCVILLRGDSRIIYSKNNSSLLNYLNSVEADTWEIDEELVFRFGNIVNIKKSHIDFKNSKEIGKIREVLVSQEN